MARALAILLLALVAASSGPARAQEEVTRGTYRYGEREVSTGYYEQYEVRPGREQPFVQWDAVHRMQRLYDNPVFVPGSGLDRMFLADAHMGIATYRYQTCASCHAAEAKNNMHVVQENIACRQCHGGEPVAAVNHYHSPLNPIRRHAYVCAKCHQGAGASFALFLVHEPSPANPATAVVFPWLFWAFWIMVGLFALTFALFLPHTILWVVREFWHRRQGRAS